MQHAVKLKVCRKSEHGPLYSVLLFCLWFYGAVQTSNLHFEKTCGSSLCCSRLCRPDGHTVLAGTELSSLCDSQLTTKPHNDGDIKECLLRLIIQHDRKLQSGSDFVVQSLVLMDRQKRCKADYGRSNGPLT